MWRDGAGGGRPDALLRSAIAAVLLALSASAAGYALLGVDALAHAGLLPPCPFRALTGLDCPGCGMTRALLRLSQLRIGDALAAHPAAPLVLGAMGLRLARARLPAFAGRHKNELAWAALCAVLLVWLARAIPH